MTSSMQSCCLLQKGAWDPIPCLNQENKEDRKKKREEKKKKKKKKESKNETTSKSILPINVH